MKIVKIVLQKSGAVVRLRVFFFTVAVGECAVRACNSVSLVVNNMS